MAGFPFVVLEVRILWLESGEVLIATRPKVAGGLWRVDQVVGIG